MASRLLPGEPLVVGANRDELMERPATRSRSSCRAGRASWAGATSSPAAPGSPSTSTGSAPGSPTSRWATPRTRPSAPAVTCPSPWPVTPAPAPPSRPSSPATARRTTTAAGSWSATAPPCGSSTSPTPGGPARATALAPGLHVLENRALGEPSAKVDLVRAALGDPRQADAIDAAFRSVLADHRVPEDDERPNSASCVHLDTFGTRSSCLVRVGAAPSCRPACGWPQAARARRPTRKSARCGTAPGRSGERSAAHAVACSGCGAVARRRRRGAPAGRPRSR